MTAKSRIELVDALRTSYQSGTRLEKGRILDHVQEATGYNRKHAVSCLTGARTVRQIPRERKKIYTNSFKAHLIEVWLLSNRVCSKRLVAILPTLLAAIEKHGTLCLDSHDKGLMLSISAATCDRLLADVRKELKANVKTRRLSSPLKARIPIRTGPWNDVAPGFCEIDLVLHSGSDLRGSFVHTLTATDIATGWTETVALIKRGEAEVLTGLRLIQSRLPMRLVGIDSDNGSEFINHLLEEYCQQTNLEFTRSREYRKNDQAHVEQKNGAVVRGLIGYNRFEGEKAHALMSALYEVSRLYNNFFQASFKLLHKRREGAKTIKVYDSPKTPFARLLQTGVIAKSLERRLQTQFERLDPAALLADMKRLQQELWKCAAPDTGGNVQPVVTPRNHQTKARPRRHASLMPHSRKGRKKDLTLDGVIAHELSLNPNLGARRLHRLLRKVYGDVPSLGTIGRRLADWKAKNLDSKPSDFS